jgi:hypothetical protein
VKAAVQPSWTVAPPTEPRRLFIWGVGYTTLGLGNLAEKQGWWVQLGGYCTKPVGPLSKIGKDQCRHWQPSEQGFTLWVTVFDSTLCGPLAWGVCFMHLNQTATHRGG